MPRLICLDTYYPQFLKSLNINPATTYNTTLRDVLSFSFGTGDSYTRNLQQLGWETMDVVVTSEVLQDKWARENGYPSNVLAAQIESFKPDVIFLQDLSIELPKHSIIVAAQHSSPWAGDSAIRQCDVVMTSFPHYMERIQNLGVQAVFNPLAFDPVVLQRVGDVPVDRPYPVTFVGGVGAPSHWLRGMEVLEAVARAIPEFRWWGYGQELLPTNMFLRHKYQGPAWGLDYYRILLQSKIVLNRHGEVAQGFSNNMRMFEATGCGAMLLTEDSKNLFDYFEPSEAVVYSSPDNAVDQIRYYLTHDNERQAIATRGQARTLADHTYQSRMRIIDKTLQEMLCHVYRS